MEGEEEGKVTGLLQGDRVDVGKNDRKGLQGCSYRERGKEKKVAGGRLAGVQKKRSLIKVEGRGCEQWHYKCMSTKERE